MTNGAFYLAVGEQYIKEAIESAKSLKTQMPNLDVTLFTDEDLDCSYFDRVKYIKGIHAEEQEDFLPCKIKTLRKMPYDENLFLDTDTRITDDISEIFDLLDRFDVAVAHAPYRIVYDLEGIPNSFPEFNTGVIAFKRNEVMENIFNRWKQNYEEHLREFQGGDEPGNKFTNSWGEAKVHFHAQPTFRKAVYESSARLTVLPSEYNCRTWLPGYLHGSVKIIHANQEDRKVVEDKLNKKIEPRVYDGGERIKPLTF